MCIFNFKIPRPRCRTLEDILGAAAGHKHTHSVAMAPPKGGWRAFPANSNFLASSPAARRLNSGFDAPRKKATINPYGRPNRAVKAGMALKKGIRTANAAAGGAILAATLGGVLASQLSKRKKKKKQQQQGAGRNKTPEGWRVQQHAEWLSGLTDRQAFSEDIKRASNEQLRALTDLIRNLYDNVVQIPAYVKIPLLGDRQAIRRISALKTPLYQRRSLLRRVGGEKLVPFVQAGLDALSS